MIFDGKIKKAVGDVADRILVHARSLSEAARTLDGPKREHLLIRIQTLLDIATILRNEVADGQTEKTV